MADEWYYTQQGQQQGPVPAAQLKQLAASGRLLPTDLVWKEGLANWVAASATRGLFPQAPASGAVAPRSGRPAPASAPASGRAPAASGGPASGRPRSGPIHVTPIDDDEENDHVEAPRARRPRQQSRGLSTGMWVAIIGGSVGALLLVGGIILLIVLLGRSGGVGPATFTETLGPGRRSYNVTFRGGQQALFSIAGQGNCDVEIYVFDRNNRLIANSVMGFTDRRSVSWMPPQTETYRIDLKNNGAIPDRLTISHN